MTRREQIIEQQEREFGVKLDAGWNAGVDEPVCATKCRRCEHLFTSSVRDALRQEIAVQGIDRVMAEGKGE